MIINFIDNLALSNKDITWKKNVSQILLTTLPVTNSQKLKSACILSF